MARQQACNIPSAGISCPVSKHLMSCRKACHVRSAGKSCPISRFVMSCQQAHILIAYRLSLLSLVATRQDRHPRTRITLLLIFIASTQHSSIINTLIAPPPIAGKDFERDMERARGCYRHLRTVFQELEECRPFELLRG